MKKKSLRNTHIMGLMIFLLTLGWLGATNVFAGELTEALRNFLNRDIRAFPKKIKMGTLELMPIKTADVKGDTSRYRAYNWTKDGSQSGIKALGFDADLNSKTHLSFDGSGLFGDSDYTGNLLFSKDDVGYMKLDYKSFRKYFEKNGGKFPPYASSLSLRELTQDLELDMGHFGLEFGQGSEQDSNFSLGYAHDTKKGIKSTLNWAYAKDSTFGTAIAQQRKITPSFYDIDNTIDTFKLKGKTKVAGFTVKGEQKYSFFNGKTLNQEQLYSLAATQSENKIIQQIESPQTKQLSTTMRAERWTLNDKTYMSFGYRFGHLRSSTLATEREYTNAASFTQAGKLVGGRFRNGDADSSQDTHTWTGQMLSNLTNDLTFITRLKGELRSAHNVSDYDTLSITEAVTSTTHESSENRFIQTGESFSLRYSGLPKTSLYSDLEFSQERNWKYLVTSTAYAEHLNNVPDAAATLGVRYTPTSKVSITSEFKHQDKIDKLEQVKGSSNSYINMLRMTSDSFFSRLSWKPLKWIEHSLKINTASKIFHLQAVDVSTSRIPSSERDFTYNVAIMPTEELMIDASYSRKLNKVGGIGSQYAYAPPAFTGNVDILSLSTSYAPTEKLSLFNTFEYARAKNKTNADSDSLTSNATGPLLWGQNEEWFNIDTGVTFSLRKDLTIEPHYAYQSFRAFDGIDSGNYSAHVYWLDVSLNW